MLKKVFLKDKAVALLAAISLFINVEPMSVGFHAVERGQVNDLDTVIVLGCGMFGIGAVVRAALRVARVIAVDIDDGKLALAKRLGAAFAVNSQTENIHERLQEITANPGKVFRILIEF